MDGLLNYTPHRELIYRPADSEPVVLPQHGNVRLVEEYLAGGSLPNGLPLTWLRYGLAEALPERQPGVVYVVSQPVVLAHPERDDLVFPAGLERNDQGDVIGFCYLARPVPAEANRDIETS